MTDNLRRLREILDTMPPSDPAVLQLAAIVDNMRAPVVYATEAGTIHWANRAAREFFGYSFSEMQGQPIGMLMPERIRRQHQEAFGRRVAADLSKREPVMDVTLHSVALTKDGAEKPVTIRLTSRRTNGSVTYTASFEEIASDG